MQVMVYRVEKEGDAEGLIHRAVRRGAEAIVGGLMIYNFALGMGLPCTWIKSGEDAIKQAVDEAVRVGRIRETERERAEFFKIIMDYTHEGILAVNREGHVTACNRSAMGILGRERGVIGAPAASVLPSASLARVLERGEEDLGVLEILGDTHLAANFVPIKIGGKTSGAVATFQNVSRIVEIEGKLRKKIYTKGHTAKYAFHDILGGGEGIKSVIRTAEKYSMVDANVLIYGETGTGKELFAHSIHLASSRAAGPFVAVNCAALPEHLLESELFGYVEGAFTGAMKGGKTGLFELAHEGTIFLDEVGEIPLTLQAKLLRVLQEREIMRIGHDRVIPVNLRIIAATNKDLKKLAAEGLFRQDILFRLDVLRINVPPLRVRREDIPLLARHFLSLYRARRGLPPVEISPRGMKVLEEYDWPGNVRELANLCERLSALEEGNAADAAAVEVLLDRRPGLPPRERSGSSPAPASAVLRIRELEKEAVRSAVMRADGNFSRAARELGISRSTLWRKWKTLEG
jgi:transcriptional regulator with PAS, ATPase and Fis domain